VPAARALRTGYAVEILARAVARLRPHARPFRRHVDAVRSGNLGRVSARAALMNSTPSSAPEEWSLDRGFGAPALVANVGVQLGAALRVEASHSRGAWMREDVINIPAGARFEDYEQRIWGTEAVFAYGRTKLRGELFFDNWEVPNVADEPVDVSWYLEGEQDVPNGFTLAARYGQIHFMGLENVGPGEPSYGTGDAARWDYDVSRLQLGIAYRLARNGGIRAEGTFNNTDSPDRIRNNLGALQLWWEF
jgi:hypothetical protein